MAWEIKASLVSEIWLAGQRQAAGQTDTHTLASAKRPVGFHPDSTLRTTVLEVVTQVFRHLSAIYWYKIPSFAGELFWGQFLLVVLWWSTPYFIFYCAVWISCLVRGTTITSINSKQTVATQPACSCDWLNSRGCSCLAGVTREYFPTLG